MWPQVRARQYWYEIQAANSVGNSVNSSAATATYFALSTIFTRNHFGHIQPGGVDVGEYIALSDRLCH